MGVTLLPRVNIFLLIFVSILSLFLVWDLGGELFISCFAWLIGLGTTFGTIAQGSVIGLVVLLLALFR